jgi:hypothetical protein
MDSNLQTALFVVWAAGFLVTLWAGVTERFRLKPYGLPRTKLVLLRRSVIDTFYTLFWFLFVPAWFVYRWATRDKRVNR